jgi:hypothetical protein
MTTYNWTIATLEHNVADGGVIVAHWRVSAVDGDYSASAYGSAGFTPDPEAKGFVPYADLTEADVLGWIWGQEEFDKDQIEAILATQIEAQKAPKTEAGVPWSN